MRDRNEQPGLWLSESEALGLLDMVVLSPGELTPEQRSAIHKLSDFCRELVRCRERPLDERPIRTIETDPALAARGRTY